MIATRIPTIGNPIKYIDPTGNRKCTTEEAATGDETCEQNYPENEPDYNIHRVIIGAHSSPASGSAITEPEANLPSILNYLISVLGNAYYTLSGAQPYKKDIFTWLSWNEYNDGSVIILTGGSSQIPLYPTLKTRQITIVIHM